MKKILKAYYSLKWKILKIAFLKIPQTQILPTKHPKAPKSKN